MSHSEEASSVDGVLQQKRACNTILTVSEIWNDQSQCDCCCELHQPTNQLKWLFMYLPSLRVLSFMVQPAHSKLHVLSSYVY